MRADEPGDPLKGTNGVPLDASKAKPDFEEKKEVPRSTFLHFVVFLFGGAC